MRKNLLLASLTAAVIAVGAATASAQQPCGGFYTIRPGDTLADIAIRCATSVPALLAANPAIRDERDFQPGGQMRMPGPGVRPTPMEACGGFYTVRPGDTLDEIAQKCGLTIPLILAANPALENPDNMRAGGKVRIPDLPRIGTVFEPVIIGPTGAVVVGPDSAAVAAAAPDAATPADTAVDPEPFVRYEGVLRRGARCTVLRTATGTEVGLPGPLTGGGFEIGDRVVVTGPAAPAAECGTDRAVTVRIMWRPRGEGAG
ncbi:MAG TPA: LysM domain-containing protein [Longimicrobiales bacterium]|nr:LysM domain-containing protein [Longimicrobiales bacterium]